MFLIKTRIETLQGNNNEYQEPTIKCLHQLYLLHGSLQSGIVIQLCMAPNFTFTQIRTRPDAHSFHLVAVRYCLLRSQ